MAREFKVFISHSWDYSDDHDNLVALLEKRGYFNVEFNEVSKGEPIDSSNILYIKQRLEEKIGSSDVVLGLAGVYASYSEWMKWELQTAKEKCIPVIAVIPRGQEKVSRKVTDIAITYVKWNTESIVEAIRENAK